MFLKIKPKGYSATETAAERDLQQNNIEHGKAKRPFWKKDEHLAQNSADARASASFGSVSLKERHAQALVQDPLLVDLFAEDATDSTEPVSDLTGLRATSGSSDSTARLRHEVQDVEFKETSLKAKGFAPAAASGSTKVGIAERAPDSPASRTLKVDADLDQGSESQERTKEQTQGRPAETADGQKEAVGPNIAEMLAKEPPKKKAKFSISRLLASKPNEYARAKKSEQIATNSTAAEPTSSWLGRVGRKKESLSVASEGAQAQKSVKPSKGARAPKASKDANAPRAGQVHLLVELDTGARIFWSLTPSSLTQVQADQVGYVLSLSAQDTRLSVQGKLSDRAARDFAFAELGEPVQVVNKSKALGAVFATSQSRVDDLLPAAISPVTALVEALLQKDGLNQTACICVLALQDEASGQSITVLLHNTGEGEARSFQVGLNAADLQFTLSQYAASLRLDVQSTKVVMYGNADLLSVASQAEFYPVEPVLYGVATRRLWWGATAAVCLIAAAGIGLAGQAYFELADLKQRSTALTAQKSQAQKRIDQAIEGRLTAFAGLQSVDLNAVSDRAGQLWAPSSKLVVEAELKTDKYTISMPMTNSAMFGNKPSVLSNKAFEDFTPLLRVSPPQGCTKSNPEISGSVNAIQINITCESPAHPLSTYFSG